jgi:hypothetical protein
VAGAGRETVAGAGEQADISAADHIMAQNLIPRIVVPSVYKRFV